MAQHKEIYAVIERNGSKQNDDNKKAFWVRIGTGFVNKDGSLNLLFDLLPTDPSVTIQLREPKPRDAE